MRAKLKLTFALCTLFTMPCVLVHAVPKATEAGVWYLLVRRADRPEKNYYELTRTARFLEPRFFSEEMVRQYKPSPLNYGADIITDGTVRYGVYQAWKVRIIATSDSQKTPTSVRNSTYVLSYSRNPDWKFAAKKYKVLRTTSRGQKIAYTDFQDGREYTIELSPEWPLIESVHAIAPSEDCL